MKSRTAVDPDTLDTRKVTETIKEGETLCALTVEEQRKAQLMNKPDSQGDYVFSNAMRTLAHGEECPVSPFQSKHLDVLRARDEGSHGTTCLSDVFVEIAAAMVMSNDQVPR